MPDLANPEVLASVLLFLTGVIASIGGAVKWLVPLMMNRGKEKAQTATRIAASASTLDWYKGLVKTYEGRVSELEAEVSRLESELGKKAQNG